MFMHVHACMHAWGPSWCTFRILIHICMQFVHDDRSGSWSWSFRIHAICMPCMYANKILQSPCMYRIHDDPDPDPCESRMCMQIVFSSPWYFHPMTHVQPVHCTRWLSSHQLPQHHEIQQQICSYTPSRSLEYKYLNLSRGTKKHCTNQRQAAGLPIPFSGKPHGHFVLEWTLPSSCKQL